ncbi:ADP-dependent glucokinase/phosphofructokinase [Mobiluncus curtisii]|nr:ADP-dependent glucokinase/phosphofructokinase [Mobiluncus curtisii]
MFLGLGANIDYELKWDTQKICQILDNTEFTDKNSLSISSRIFSCMKTGQGAEFSVPNESYLNYICSSIPYQETLGGTAARAALIISLFNQNCYLHLVNNQDDYQHLLPKNVKCIWNEESNLPSSPHVIIQYPAGVRIRHNGGEFITPNSNRIILTADLANEQLPISNKLTEIVKQCPILLISGFNSITDRNILSQRLSNLENCMLNKSDCSTVIYEDAAFHDEKLHKYVIESVTKYADILSFNEDELSSLLGFEVDIRDIHQMSHVIDVLDSQFPNNTTILHNSIWNGTSAPASSKLFNALKFAVSTSTSRYIFGDSISKDRIYNTYRKITLDTTNELVTTLNNKTTWSFIGTPQVDCPYPTTIGLGDSFIGGLMTALNDPSITNTTRS